MNTLRGVQVERLDPTAEQLGVGLHGGVSSKIPSVEDRLSIRQEEQQHGRPWTAERDEK